MVWDSASVACTGATGSEWACPTSEACTEDATSEASIEGELCKLRNDVDVLEMVQSKLHYLVYLLEISTEVVTSLCLCHILRLHRPVWSV